MADPRFHNKEEAKTLKALADIAGTELGPNAKGDLKIEDVAPLDEAGAGQISFFDNVKYKEQLKATKAAACIIHKDASEYVPEGVQTLISASPYKAYALIAQGFYPAATADGVVHDQAHVDDRAKIAKDVSVEAGAVIQAGVEIGEGTIIRAGAVIAENVVIGKNCIIGANAAITHAIIGDHVNIYQGVCIGQDGFGFAIDPAGHVKVPQLGRVIIEDHVEIGSNTTIDRGAGPDTIIGQGTWIDNQVQIAHNVKIGKGCVIVAQVGIAGSTELEDFVVVAAQTGIAGHLKIGMGTRIGAQSGVMRDLPAGSEVLGAPAIPSKEFMRQIATLRKLSKAKG